MKKLISILTIATLILLTSCSKSAKLNRKLDGEWIVTSENGVASSTNLSISFVFEKDKKDNGKVTMNQTINGNIFIPMVSIISKGTYTLTKDEVITSVLTIQGETETEVYIVNNYDKTDMTLTGNGGSVYTLKKM